jgi:diguanylate cyclase (GGDEF)-like protein
MKGTTVAKPDNSDRLPKVADFIDECLAQPWYRISFPAALERRFEQSSAASRCSQMRFGLLIMSAVRLGLLVSDLLHDRQIFMLGLLLRLGVCLPLLLSAAYALSDEMPTWLQAVVVAAPASITFFCDECLARHATSLLGDRYFMGAAMSLFATNVLLPLRLRHAIPYNAVNLISYNAVLFGLMGPLSIPKPITLALAMSILVMSSAGIRWRNEVVERRTFLLKERDRIHRQQLAWANRQLTELSYTDSLTELPNRRFFDEAMMRLWKSARISGDALSVLMIDIDHFKTFNDALGHAAGDKCLRRVAQAMQFSIRADKDLVARYGGEEFIAVIPGASLDEASEIAERIRVAVQELQIPHPSNPLSAYVSVCVGLATAVNPQRLDRLDDLIRDADFALYKAKSLGRNCVTTQEVAAADQSRMGAAEAV